MTFLLALLVFVLIITIMSVGVIFGREPIKGSCGGLGAVGIDQECEICGGDPQRCDSEMTPATVQTFYPDDQSRSSSR
ncbi:(Na+)-NQR maturation NqrM [Luminiphilus sp.]|jgi:uncharacterized protein|nr:(Na+)-NQR maturation NqrM [Luminiphilus sp.]MDA8985797.1 (Na+)-NQR maturation NqrM [Luminiphilus sp.]MDB2643498.1 (Na+)-NQR maturation NqrM [Luminiphilus sp.]MDB4048954.1 (Na+)-NQR maturation NqrM [Luminiphilus sp.]MDC1117270.1 (Na+)-NQR maturation NqrM [Luminiphilus sp.]